MITFPNCKINIGLNIIEKRPDNFHNIESVFYPIELTDVLEIIKTNTTQKVELKITGMEIPGNLESNLCVKAYQLLDNDFHLTPVKIILHKIIPMGAGLGGGSSDGAFALKMLNEIFNLHLSAPQLINYASKLGSDCAFFIENTPALGTEKGNILTPINLCLNGLFIVIVKPSIFVGTAEAYAGVKPQKPEITLTELISKPIAQWKDLIKNDFESSIFKNHPAIENIKQTMYQKGALYSSMSGSGSSVFGIFDVLPPDIEKYFSDCFYWSKEI